MFDEGYRIASSDDNSGSLKEKFQFYFKQSRVQILILFVATILVYANSLNVPFYLDDYHSIVENPIIHDMSTMLDKRDFQIMRLTGTFSLADNYSLHQTSVLGYHLVSLVIHLLSGLAVFFLLRGLIQVLQYNFSQNNTVQNQLSNSYLLYLPFFSALIFLLHPLQTQAVTYIVQRHALLAALFYISSMAVFVYARFNHLSGKEPAKQGFFYFLTAFFAVLALLSKENTVTLVVSIFLIEILFFQHFSIKKILIWSISAILLALLLALCLHYIMGVSFELIDSYTHTIDVKHISRLEYFSTQMLVLWHYIKLFIFPVGLHLDYDVMLQKSFFSFSVIIALLGHLVVLLTSILLAKQKPILVFAVFFYYISQSVESGIIPILDLAFEHRTYLPNLGLSILLASLFVFLLEKKPAKVYPIIIIVFIVLALLTIQRNNQWANPIQFYQNETQLSPNKERVWAELGKVYLREKRFNEALKAFAKALNLGKEGNTVIALPTTFLNTYLALLYSGQIQKAVYFESIMPVNGLSRHDKSVFYFMQANRLVQAKVFDKAIQSYQKSISLNPRQLDAKAHLAALYIETGKQQQGKLLLNEVLHNRPGHKIALMYQQRYNK